MINNLANYNRNNSSNRKVDKSNGLPKYLMNVVPHVGTESRGNGEYLIECRKVINGDTLSAMSKILNRRGFNATSLHVSGNRFALSVSNPTYLHEYWILQSYGSTRVTLKRMT